MKISYIIFIAIFIILIQNTSLVFGQFNIGIKSPKIICSYGEMRCSSDKTQVLTCNSEGTDFNVVVESCTANQECSAIGATLKCVKRPLFEIENIPFFPLISLILAIIVVILWYLLVKNQIKKKTKK